MAGETTLTYNGVPLSFIETAEVDSEAVTDPLAGKDLLYVRHTIRVEAILAGLGALGTLPPARPGETPANTMARIEHLLSQPRRPFVYAVDGVVLYSSNGLDPAGGPVPTPPKITRVTANSFRIAYAVAVCTNECPERNGPSPIWSSLRWTQQQIIDEANYSTLVTTGRLVANADMLQKLKSIDQLREVTVPPVPPNFIRHSAYTIAADGLALDFVHTDQEQYVGPPADAVSIKGKFTHNWIKNGGKWFITADVVIEGKKNAPKGRLMATALSIAFNRLKKANPMQDKGRVIVSEGTMWEVVERNVVGVRLGALTNPGNTVFKKDEPGSAYQFGKAVGDGVAAAGLSMIPVVGPALALGYLAAQAAALVQQARDKAKADAAALKQNPLGVVPGDLSQWGSPLLGCTMPGDPPAAGIGPDLYGNLPAFRLFAAAFRDPCLDNTVAIAAAAKAQAQATTIQSRSPTPITSGPGPYRQTYPTTSQVLVLNGLPPAVPVQLTTNVDPYPGVFDEYMVECEYRRRENTSVLPSTVSGSPGRQVQWANPEMFLRCTWTATKWGAPPTVPEPTPKDSNTVLTGSVILPMNAELGLDGCTLIYSASGCFDYQFLNAGAVNVTIPAAPWLNADANRLPAFPTDSDMIFGDTTATLRSQQR